jgi:hypothetical protein
MEKIEKTKLEQLLQIVPDHPTIRIAHFTDSGMEMTDILSSFCQQKEYEYQINCTDPSFYEKVSETYAHTRHVKVVKFTLERPKYMIQGKLYDFLFVTSAIDASMREACIERCHPVIKNAGNIIVFLPKGKREERYEWMRLLEEHNYVASSIIDDMFEHYDVLISKKMHGWGG